METQRSSFSGSIGFVLAAAGSAVGLGNIWRFPYLAAEGGGGLFLFIYIGLALTFGFTLLMSEVAIGRHTKQSCLTAYGKMDKRFGWLGGLASIVPFLILPYYCVIGGWVMKYAFSFVIGQGVEAAGDSFFTDFITGNSEPIIYTVVFLLLTAFVVFRGVNKGIEALSKVLMPILFVLIIGISIYSMTLSGGEEYGNRTGMDGFWFYVIPNVDGMGVVDILKVVMSAMGQLFYSISVAMGIMVTYGSYFKDKDNLVKSVSEIEIFDTLIAFLAGVMIIPAVYVFLGPENMAAGPGLMFVAMPKIFADMGFSGTVLGTIFFLMVLFAALTSSVSLLEAVVSGMVDKGVERKKATLIESGVAIVIAVVVCLGYNVLYFDLTLPNGSVGQILDILDYLSNNILMPVLAIGTCILVGWIVKPKKDQQDAHDQKDHYRTRKVGTCVLLSVITLGIYTLYWKYLLIKGVRSLKKNESGCLGEVLCLLFVPFYSIYWWYTRGKSVKEILSEQGISPKSNEIAYLILSIFGLEIIAMALMQADFCSYPQGIRQPVLGYDSVIIGEVTKNGERLRRKYLYIVMVKFIAPILLFILLLGSFGVFG